MALMQWSPVFIRWGLWRHKNCAQYATNFGLGYKYLDVYFLGCGVLHITDRINGTPKGVAACSTPYRITKRLVREGIEGEGR
jgi:hypothetical protein